MGIRSTRGMHGMGARAKGLVPQAVGIDSAMNFVGAHEHVMRGGGSDGPRRRISTASAWTAA